jgi:hypothetical protein
MHVWYCPLEGLEYRCLFVVGWRAEHRLTVDGVVWVKMRKSADDNRSLSCLN